MKITIVSSMTFFKEITKAKENLELQGHLVTIPPNTELCTINLSKYTELEYCMSENLLSRCFERIEASDAIVVLNYEKKGIQGYIGGASLMEIGLAYYLRKKIFILFNLPEDSMLSYVSEIHQTRPIFLQGNLSLIST